MRVECATDKDCSGDGLNHFVGGGALYVGAFSTVVVEQSSFYRTTAKVLAVSISPHLQHSTLAALHANATVRLCFYEYALV